MKSKNLLLLAGVAALLTPVLAASQAGPGPAPTTLTAGAGITLTPNPIRGQGTIALSGTPVPGVAAPNTVLAGPTTLPNAAPTMRALVGNDLPFPSIITLGGIESSAVVAHNWINGISTLGLPSIAQPAFTDISGTAQVGQGGTGTTSSTGTGSVVLNNGPTLIAPALGTPASGTATNLTGTAAGLTAGNVTTNANLTGPITSSGNATSIAAQTGTGSTFVVQTSPTLTTPNIGAATGASLGLSGTAAQTFTTGASADTNSTIVLSTNTVATLPGQISGTFLHSADADGAFNTWVWDSAAAANSLYFRRAQGTLASPTALASGNQIEAFQWRGYDGTAWSNGQAQISGVAAEAWGTGAHGTYLDFSVTPVTTITNTSMMRVDGVTFSVQLGGSNGNESLRAPHVASAVNRVQATGATTGNKPSIVAAGSDTNISLSLNGQGTGGVVIPNTQADALQVGNQAAPTGTIISKNATGAPQSVTGGLLYLQGADSANTSLVFNTNTGLNNITLQESTGTAGAPGALLNARTLLQINPLGYNGTSWVGGNPIDSIQTGQAWSVGANGLKRTFSIVPNGAAAGSPEAVMVLDSTNNSVDVGGPTAAEAARFDFVTSAVNRVEFSGAVTTAAPSMTFTGADTNVGGTIAVKGTGTLALTPASITMPNVATTGTTVAYACFTAAGAIVRSTAPCD